MKKQNRKIKLNFWWMKMKKIEKICECKKLYLIFTWDYKKSYEKKDSY